MTFRRVDLGHDPGAPRAGSTTPATSATSCGSRPSTSAALFDRIVAAGEPHGLRLFGMRALMSLRLEKSYGTWFREYRPIYTPLEAGITRYIELDHEFIGRAAHEAEVARGGPDRRLVAFVVEPDPDDPADVIGDEPVWHDGAVVGWVTSGGYGHHVGQSIALGLRAGGAGRRRTARAATVSRSRSSAGAGRRGSSPSRCSTRRACGCASDRAARSAATPRPPGGSSSTAGRSRSSRATASPSRSCGPASSPAAAAPCASPATAANCLGERRRHRLRADVPGAGAAGTRRSSGIRRGRRRYPPLARLARRRREREVRVERRRRRASSSSAAGQRPPAAAAAEAADAACSSSMPRDGDEVVGDLPGPDGRRADAGRDARTSRPTRSSSRPARPRSSRSARATTSPGC